MDEFSPGPRANSQRASPLRIGLLIDSTTASQSIHDFVRWAQSRPDISVTHLILCTRPTTSKSAGFLERVIHCATRQKLHSALSELAFCIVELFERQILKRNSCHSGQLRKFDLSPLLKDTVSVTPIMSESGLSCRFDAADVQRVKDLNLGLLLSCGYRNPSGEILNASKLGIISLEPGDSRTNRGGPAGFWEVYLRHDMTGFTIRRLTGDLGAGDVLMRGRFATRHYYLLNQAFLHRMSSYYLKLIVDEAARTGRLPDFEPNFPYSGAPFRKPAAHETAIYLAKLCQILLKKKMRRLRGIDYRWSVAFTPGDWRHAELWRGIKLKNRPFHYLADPFVIYRNGKSYCFVEDYNFLKQRASIAVYELTDTGGIRVGAALEENFHLSFPYLFEYRGELYMCPESSENRDIRIYKCIDFPLVWKLEKVLMEKVSAADTMIFERDGKWWMFTNIDPTEIGDHCSELSIFSAKSPLATAWDPHPMNPIVVDASRARNAGYLVDGDNYFRCSQGQGFDLYGRRVLINKITELTATSYRELCSSVIAPSFEDGIVGMHHLHSNGRITVFDLLTSSRIKTGT